jgi:hypothetical protein
MFEGEKRPFRGGGRRRNSECMFEGEKREKEVSK